MGYPNGVSHIFIAVTRIRTHLNASVRGTLACRRSRRRQHLNFCPQRAKMQIESGHRHQEKNDPAWGRCFLRVRKIGLEPSQMQHAGGVLLAAGCNFPGDNAPCFSLPDRFSLAGAYIVGKKLHFCITAAPAVPKSDAYSFFQMLFFRHRKPSKEHSSPCIDFLGHQNDGCHIHGL